MEKEGKKRPAVRKDDREGKNAKPRPNDEEVEEFFALIRRIRSTSKLLGKDNSSRSPSFQWDDFVTSSVNATAGIVATGTGDTDGRKDLSIGRSSKDDERKDEDDEEEGAKGEGVEDNGLPGWLDLNVDLAAANSPC